MLFVTLSLVGDPRGGVNHGSIGVSRRLGDIAAVQAHPHRQRHVGVGPVVILDGPLDRGGGLNRLVGRGEQRHEPVTQRLGLYRAGDLQSGPDQFVVKVDDLVGGGVTHPHPKIGGAFEIREQDREGSLHRFSLRHSPYLPEQDHVNGDGVPEDLVDVPSSLGNMTQPPPSDQVRTIDRDELWAKISRGDRFRLVMALNEWAFRAKHIPGSEHFNTPEELFASLDTEDEIVVYCTSPECHSSIALYWALLEAGFDNVRRYSGGLTDWEAAGLPLEGEWVSPASS